MQLQNYDGDLVHCTNKATIATKSIRWVKVKVFPKVIIPEYGPTLLQLANGFPHETLSNRGWVIRAQLLMYWTTEKNNNSAYSFQITGENTITWQSTYFNTLLPEPDASAKGIAVSRLEGTMKLLESAFWWCHPPRVLEAKHISEPVYDLRCSSPELEFTVYSELYRFGMLSVIIQRK